MDVNVGDKVQIINGGMDITNGRTAKAGLMYGEGGPLWATVELVDDQWSTGGRWNLPTIVTKVRCKAIDGSIVWQVQPQDIASNVIRANVPVQSVPTPLPNVIAPTEAGKADLNVSTETSITTSIPPNVSYVTKPRAESWAVGIVTKGTTTGKLPTTAAQKTQSISGSSMGTCATISYKERS